VIQHDILVDDGYIAGLIDWEVAGGIRRLDILRQRYGRH
jgi:hypothetical protein